MIGPEANPTSERVDEPPYARGEAVRIYVDRNGERIPEDDWEFRHYDPNPDVVTSAKNTPESEHTQWAQTNKAEFDNWQREKVAQGTGRLATESVAATTPEAERIVEEEEARGNKTLDDELESWGRFNSAGEYVLLVNPHELSKLIDIPSSIIKSAAEKGFTPEYLLSARENPFTARRLRQVGIEWGPAEIPVIKGGESSEPLPPLRFSADFPKSPDDLETMASDEVLGYLEKHGFKTVEDYEKAYDAARVLYRGELGKHFKKVSIKDSGDPMMYLEARGIEKRMKKEDIAKEIETSPRKLRRSLERPGKLPLGLNKVPYVGRRTGWLVLARSMHRKELQERKKEGLGKNYEDGLLRIGIPRTKKNYEYIKKHDEVVRVLKNKLRPTNTHEYRGIERWPARRDLAELIQGTLVDSEALNEHKEILHPSVYKHSDFGPIYSDFKKAKDR